VPHEAAAATAPPAKLVLTPADDSLLQLAGHSSHSSHSSHYSHRSSSYAPSYTPAYGTSSPPTPAPSYTPADPAPKSTPSAALSGDTSADSAPKYAQPTTLRSATPRDPAARTAQPSPDRSESTLPLSPTEDPTDNAPVSSEHSTALTAADLAGKSDVELVLMRTELYARHGYGFPIHNAASAKLRKHFLKNSWYRPNTDDATVAYWRMSQAERHNYNLIARIEKQRRAGSKNGL
jgi:hypothetical protein